MSWRTLIDSLIRMPTHSDFTAAEEAREILETIERTNPALYWYPGSGEDFSPLLFGASGVPEARGLIWPENAATKRPLILWMSDYADWLWGFPTCPYEGNRDRRWQVRPDFQVDLRRSRPMRFAVHMSASANCPRAVIPLVIFKARFQGALPREAEAWVIFSAAESESLLKSVFVSHRLRIEVVQLFRQGGFSLQRRDRGDDFEQYRDVPRLLREHAAFVGMPSAYYADIDLALPGYRCEQVENQHFIRHLRVAEGHELPQQQAVVGPQQETFREMLRTTLFAVQDEHNLVLIPEADVEAGMEIPVELFPDTCRVLALPAGEGFVPALRAILEEEQPRKVFMLPPLAPRQQLSVAFRTEHGRKTLEEAALAILAEGLAEGTTAGVLMPEWFFTNASNAAIRLEAFARKRPFLFVSLQHSCETLGMHFHPDFRMSGVFFGGNHGAEAGLRFMRYPAADTAEAAGQITRDLHNLMALPAGATEFGYVWQGELRADALLSWDLYSPEFQHQLADLAQLGAVRPLGEIMETKRGLHRTMHADLLVPINEANPQHVRVLDGRNIRADGTIDLDGLEHCTLAMDRWQLQPGDICIRQIMSTQWPALAVVEIQPAMLPLAFSASVVVLRAAGPLPEAQRQAVVRQLRSPFSLRFLRAHGMRHQLSVQCLLDVPVAIPA